MAIVSRISTLWWLYGFLNPTEFFLLLFFLLVQTQPNEHSSFSQIDNITLNEDDYQYMLNDNTHDYNGIIPDYLDPSISDFVFADECRTELNLPEFHSNSNSSNTSSSNNNNATSNNNINNNSHYSGTNIQSGNPGNSNCSHAVDVNCSNINSNNANTDIATDLSYSIINLDSDIQAFTATTSTASNVPTFYASDYDHSLPIEQRSMHCSNFLNTNASASSYPDPFTSNDSDNVNGSDSNTESGYLCPNGFFYGDGGKFFPAASAKTLDTNVDFMFVSPDEIIDPANVILDLTNDEVEQILDDNLISVQDLDVIGGATSRSAPEIQSCKRLPRINIATNLTKAFVDVTNELDGKLSNDSVVIDHILTIDDGHADDGLLDAVAVDEVDVGSAADPCERSEADTSVMKKKSGRTKGSRQLSKCFFLIVQLFIVVRS